MLLTPTPRVNNQEFLSQRTRSEEHTSELQSRQYLVCRLLLEKKTEQRPQLLVELAVAAARRRPGRVGPSPRPRPRRLLVRGAVPLGVRPADRSRAVVHNTHIQ